MQQKKKEQRPPTSQRNVMLKIRLCQKNRPSAKHKSLCVNTHRYMYELLRFLQMILYNFTYVFNYTRRQIYIIGHGSEYVYFDVGYVDRHINVDTNFFFS